MKILNLLLSVLIFGACTISKPDQGLERYPASPVEKNVLNSEGVYPTSLIQKSGIIPGKIQIYFNQPPYTDPGGVGLVPALISHIKASKKSIKLAIFQFNHPEIFNALKEAASKGVKIFLSTDLCYSNKTGYKEFFEDLRAHLNKVGQSSSQVVDDGTPSCDLQFNHNKYIVFDDEIAWFGSFNPTAHGAVENVELSISLRDRDAAKVLLMDFDQLFAGKSKVAKKGVYTVSQNGKEELKALDEKEVTAIIHNNGIVTYPTVKVGEHQFEFIFSPKVKSLSRIVEEVYASEKEILFSSFAIADAMLISSLINKHKGKNISPVLLLPHPGEKAGVVLRTEEGRVLKTDKEIKDFLLQTKKDLDQTLRSSKNYQTPKGELKGVFRYFHPLNATTKQVKVEGIFNSKVIDAESTKDRLSAASVKLFSSTLNGELHNKLFLIDESVTIFGSHNFSQAAENVNDELTVIVKSGPISKFLKQELYEKTKFFAVPSHKRISIPTLAITEIHSESSFKVSHQKKSIDSGDYVEVYNFGEENVNLLGMRLDDRFFPAKEGEVFKASTNAGFSGELVGFLPHKEAGKPGTQVYRPEATVLKPKSAALIVGRYFHDSYYKKQFEAKFTEQQGRKPKADEYPVLLTIGAHGSFTLGDGTSGLRSRDKISLYHVDNHTVIDRFEHPEVIPRPDMVLSRETTLKELQSRHSQKLQNSREERVRFFIGGQKQMLDDFYGLIDGYTSQQEWKITDNGSPGLVSFSDRSVASGSEVVVIEGRIAESAKSFRDGFIIIEDGRFKQVIFGKLPSGYPAPVVKDVVIYPGLIDGHNHLKYNFFPLWVTNKFFNNRYEWPELSVYTKGIKEIYKKVYSDIPQCLTLAKEMDRNKCLAEERCHVLRMGEIKALLGGTTAIQGSTSFDDTTADVSFRGVTPYYIGTGKKRSLSKARVIENMLDECSLDGAHNLERLSSGGMDTVRSTAMEIGSDAFGSHLVGTEKFKSSGAARIANEYRNDSSFKLGSPETWQEKTKAFYMHAGEGVDESSRGEWEIIQKLGLGLPQSVVIHGLAFKEAEIKAMARQGVPLIWSPTSNALLYKDVARVDLAKKNQVLVGLGSDWSLSGTKSMLYELKVAKSISDKKFPGVLSSTDLWDMATINNARIAGLESVMGKVAQDLSADFFLVDKKLVKGSPADSLLRLKESDIQSTWVKGLPQTGELEEIKRLNQELGLKLKIVDLKKIDPESCESNHAFLTTDKNAQGLQKVIDRYRKAYDGLNPKIKSALNKEFSKIDGFCQEKDQQAVVKAMEAVQ